MAAEERLICSGDALGEGKTGVRFVFNRGQDEIQAFVVRFRGVPRAFVNRCGHVPVELDWNPGEFFDDSGVYLICATHGALYAPDTGRCLLGRCQGRGLTPVAVEERDGNIYLTPTE